MQSVDQDTRRFDPGADFGLRAWIRFFFSALYAILDGRIFRVLRPKPIDRVETHCRRGAPLLRRGQSLKVMTWNVQFMAGKGYVFFFDTPDGSGKDERPGRDDVFLTLEGVARIIRQSDPDVVMLQELDDGAARTAGIDELDLLLEQLPRDYRCHASAFYWRAGFVPHPRVRGSVGLKLSVISKFRILDARRHQLAVMPAHPIMQHFSLKRCLLEVRLAMSDGSAFHVLTTHLSAFAQGSATLQQQVVQIRGILDDLTERRTSWILGGDFNLLPDHKAFVRLPSVQSIYYNPRSEIDLLSAVYRSTPSPEETGGSDFKLWYTHFPNDSKVKRPDRTIDYLFFSPDIDLGHHSVITGEALHLSDHLPVTAQIRLP